MRKIYYLALITMALFCLSSCKSNEDRAKSLASEKIKAQLYIPESFELASFKLDSAFYPYDSKDFVNLAVKMLNAGEKMDKAESDMQEAERNMALYDVPYQSAYMKIEYSQAKAKYEEAQSIMEQQKSLAIDLRQELDELLSKKSEFIGFKSNITYRAHNNAGNVVMGHARVVYDKDITEVEQIYDMDSSEEFVAYLVLLKLIEGDD